MKKISLMLLSYGTIVLLVSCKSFKNELIQDNGIHNAIQNAILDFSKTSHIYSKGKVFSVSVSELENDKNLFVIRIGENSGKMFQNKEAKVGSKGKLASRYLKKKNGKLFYWWDDDYPLNQETISIFKEYNLLTSDKLEVYDSEIDDSKKAVHYYFCKDGPSNNYEKITTNIGIGYYDIPNIKCLK